MKAPTTTTLAAGLGLGLFAACGGESGPEAPPPAPPPHVVEIVARGLTFEAPSETPSGWTTLRLRNVSEMAHFAVLERLPEGIGIEEQQRDVAPVFQRGMDLLNAGEAEAALEAFGALPAWFGDIVFLGGAGLVSAGKTADATVYLEPGTYLLECYVKTNGIFHSVSPDPDTYGMVHELRVTDAASGAPEPVADVSITISSENGFTLDGEPRPGPTTFAVRFADQKVHENFVGHDVHVARLAEDTDLDAVAAWMDWRAPKGLETPAPVEFVGGLGEMPAGTTGYFTVRLAPGRYALVAEVPSPAEKGMLEVFTVSADE